MKEVFAVINAHMRFGGRNTWYIKCKHCGWTSEDLHSTQDTEKAQWEHLHNFINCQDKYQGE